MSGINMAHAQTTASLNAVESVQRGNRSSAHFSNEVERAIKAGFSEREAPFAAAARLSRGPTTVARMRAHLRASVPTLYGGEA